MAEPGDLTDDEKARRAHITEQLEGIAARFEERNSDLFPDGTGERAPIRLATDQFIGEVAALGPKLAELGDEFEGEVILRCKITIDRKSRVPVATARVERPTIKSVKLDAAFESSRMGDNAGQAVLALFDA
jgi:hypothetical protein